MPKSGEVIDQNFVLDRAIGRGGFGEVWLAHDRSSGADVAIKFIKTQDSAARARFAIEAQAVMRIHSPYCVRPIAYGVGETVGPYLATEYAHGVEIGEWLQGDPGRDRITTIASQILMGLAAAHRQGVVHRDLTQSNVIVRLDGTRERAAIIDFGLARLAGRPNQDITKTGVALGTPGYMSPEQLRGEKTIGPAADMYAFGSLLFLMLTGKPPYAGKSALEIAMAHLRSPIPRMPPSIPRPLANLTRRLLSKEAANRPSADEALAVLMPQPGNPASRPSSLLWGASIVLTVAAIAAIAAVAMKITEPRPTPYRGDPSTAARRAPAPPSEDLVPDLGTTSDAETATACNGLRQYHPGVQQIDDVWVRIPPDYDPKRLYRQIILFHDGWQEPYYALDAPDFDAIGGASDEVIIAPRGNPMAQSKHWYGNGLTQRAMEDVERVVEHVCVERARRYLIGYGHGGRAAFRFACNDPATVAVATFAHRIDRRLSRGPASGAVDTDCFPEGTPVLAILPRHDPFVPADGKSDCLRGDVPGLTLDHHVRRLTEEMKCVGTAEAERSEALCYDSQCPAPLRICRVNGGRSWPGPGLSHGFVASAARMLRDCPDSPPTDFAVLEEIWSFFDEAAAKKPSGE